MEKIVGIQKHARKFRKKIYFNCAQNDYFYETKFEILAGFYLDLKISAILLKYVPVSVHYIVRTKKVEVRKV